MPIFHIKTSITTLLKKNDRFLEALFAGRNASELRQEFKERLVKGEIYIGCEGCDTFSPITGCPGHQSD